MSTSATGRLPLLRARRSLMWRAQAEKRRVTIREIETRGCTDAQARKELIQQAP